MGKCNSELDPHSSVLTPAWAPFPRLHAHLQIQSRPRLTMKAQLPVPTLAAAWLTLTAPVASQLLVGYGFYPYGPLCAESCLRALSPYTLNCTVPADHHGGHSHGSSTTPDCYASNTPFLTSAAWCFSTKCAEHNVPVSTLQRFWEQFVTGSNKVPAKWSYPIALSNVDPQPPTYHLGGADMDLNVTSVVSPDAYLKQWNVLGMVAREGVVESKYRHETSPPPPPAFPPLFSPAP